MCQATVDPNKGKAAILIYNKVLCQKLYGTKMDDNTGKSN